MRCVAGPNRSRATDPLYGIGTALPPDTTYSGNDACASEDVGASTLTTWPRPCITSASCSTWDCTPPGTSNE